MEVIKIILNLSCQFLGVKLIQTNITILQKNYICSFIYIHES